MSAYPVGCSGYRIALCNCTKTGQDNQNIVILSLHVGYLGKMALQGSSLKGLTAKGAKSHMSRTIV